MLIVYVPVGRLLVGGGCVFTAVGSYDKVALWMLENGRSLGVSSGTASYLILAHSTALLPNGVYHGHPRNSAENALPACLSCSRRINAQFWRPQALPGSGGKGARRSAPHSNGNQHQHPAHQRDAHGGGGQGGGYPGDNRTNTRARGDQPQQQQRRAREHGGRVEGEMGGGGDEGGDVVPGLGGYNPTTEHPSARDQRLSTGGVVGSVPSSSSKPGAAGAKGGGGMERGRDSSPVPRGGGATGPPGAGEGAGRVRKGRSRSPVDTGSAQQHQQKGVGGGVSPNRGNGGGAGSGGSAHVSPVPRRVGRKPGGDSGNGNGSSDPKAIGKLLGRPSIGADGRRSSAGRASGGPLFNSNNNDDDRDDGHRHGSGGGGGSGQRDNFAAAAADLASSSEISVRSGGGGGFSMEAAEGVVAGRVAAACDPFSYTQQDALSSRGTTPRNV